MIDRIEKANPLTQREEIERSQWIESEKRSHDIGWMHAVTEWQQLHYGDWKHYIILGGLNKMARRPQSTMKPKRTFSTKHRRNHSKAMQAWHEKRQQESAQST